MKNGLGISIFFFLVSLISSKENTLFTYTIEAEDCEGVEKPFTSINNKKIKGMFSVIGFAYLTDSQFSFNVTVPEDNIYKITAIVAQIYDQGGRLQTISINGVDFQYKVPYYDTWTEFDFGMHKLNKGPNKIVFKPINGYALYDSIIVIEVDLGALLEEELALARNSFSQYYYNDLQIQK